MRLTKSPQKRRLNKDANGVNVLYKSIITDIFVEENESATFNKLNSDISN